MKMASKSGWKSRVAQYLRSVQLAWPRAAHVSVRRGLFWHLKIDVEGNGTTQLSLLLAKDFITADEDVRLPNSSVALEESALVESGSDFDLYQCRVRGRR